MRYHFANVRLYLPRGWIDLTPHLPNGFPPTLCRGDVPAGVLQFTTARYTGGVRPRLDREALQTFLREFEHSHHFTPAPVLTEFQNPAIGTFGACSDYWQPDEFTRLWSLTDGENLALVTFITAETEKWAQVLETELQEAHRIVESIMY